MALTGTWGGNAVTTSFRKPVKIGAKCSADEYPNGTISVNISSSASPTRAWQRISGSSVSLSINFYLCDSNGNNKIKLFTVSGFITQGNFLFSPTSTTISNTGKTLKGKSLYVVATGDTAYVGTYGKITMTVNTSTATYKISKAVSPAESGTVTLGSKTAASGSSVNISASAETGYSFSNWTTTGGTIASPTSSSTTLTMPSKNVTVTANFEVSAGKSTFTLNKSAYSGGETAVMTITALQSSYTHKYRLVFGDGMDTGLVDVAAGISTVNIYLPVAWSMKIRSGTSVSGGRCYLYTYDGITSLGYTEVDGLSYTAMNNTIPAMTVYRTDINGNAAVYGGYGKYSITVPSSITNYKLRYGNSLVSQPAFTGFILPSDKKMMDQGQNHMVTLSMTYGSETFTISKDLPKVLYVVKQV